MLRQTHLAAAISAALILMRPDTPGGVLMAAAGGAVGGWICDIDCKDVGFESETAPGMLPAAAVCCACLALDALLGQGAVAWTLAHWGPVSLLGACLFVLGFGLGLFVSGHRGFMHSLAAAAWFTLSLGAVCRPLALPFGVGFLSHLLLDLPNKKGLRLFFPLRARFCLSWCSARGRVNTLLCLVCSLSAAGLFGFLAARSLPAGLLPSPWGPANPQAVLLWYALASVWAAAVVLADRKPRRRPKALDALLPLLCAAGGAAGAYAALALTARRTRLRRWQLLCPLLTAAHVFALTLLLRPV